MGEPHNHKTTLLDTLLCLCLSSQRRAWITSTAAPHVLSSMLNPTSRTLQCQGWQQTERKSGPCSIILYSEQCGFKSHMPGSIVSCGWIHCCPGMGHCVLLFLPVSFQNLSTLVASERLKILLCPSGHFVFLGKLVIVAECNTWQCSNSSQLKGLLLV